MSRKHIHHDLLERVYLEATGDVPIQAFVAWCVLRAICTDHELHHTTLILDMFERYGPSRGGKRAEQLKEIMTAEAATNEGHSSFILPGDRKPGKDGDQTVEVPDRPQKPAIRDSIFRRLRP